MKQDVDVKWKLPTAYQVRANKAYKEFLKERAKDPQKTTSDDKALNLAFAKAFKLPAKGKEIARAMSKDKNMLEVAKVLIKKLKKMGYSV